MRVDGWRVWGLKKRPNWLVSVASVKILTFTFGDETMCGGAPEVDNSAAEQARREAAEARAREEKRKADIQLGQTRINETFSQFDDPYYDARRTAYLDYANPQLNDQHEEARKNLTFNLARGGNLRSQAGIDQLAKLSQAFQFQQANTLSEADRQRQLLRDDVENERQQLFNQLDASADPDAASNAALTRSQFISGQVPAFSPLGDLFSNVAMTGGSQYLAGQRNADLDRIAQEYIVPTPSLPGKRGSGKVFN